MLNQNFIYLGSAVAVFGGIYYVIETVKGRIKPNRVSFLLWSIAPLIAFFAQIKQGVGLEALMTFITGFWPLAIFVASFVNKKSEWKLTKFDLLCGILSIVGLFLWMITKVGNIAIFFSIVADAMAAIPTVVKVYKHPQTEVAWPWLTPAIGVALTLLTLKEFTFANSGFIIYIISINMIIYFLIQFKFGVKMRRITR